MEGGGIWTHNLTADNMGRIQTHNPTADNMEGIWTHNLTADNMGIWTHNLTADDNMGGIRTHNPTADNMEGDVNQSETERWGLRLEHPPPRHNYLPSVLIVCMVAVKKNPDFILFYPDGTRLGPPPPSHAPKTPSCPSQKNASFYVVLSRRARITPPILV